MDVKEVEPLKAAKIRFIDDPRLRYRKLSARKAHIENRTPAELKVKRTRTPAGLSYLNLNLRKRGLTDDRPIQTSKILISRRVDEGIPKDYRNDGIIAGNKSGRFNQYWTFPGSDTRYSNVKEAKQAANGKPVSRIADTSNQLSVLSSAIDSYAYDPNLQQLLLRYTSGPKEYSFANVTQRRKDELDTAASKGRFVYYVLRKYNHDDRY